MYCMVYLPLYGYSLGGKHSHQKIGYTPENAHFVPKNQLVEKDNHLPSTSICWVQNVDFQGGYKSSDESSITQKLLQALTGIEQ